MPESLYKSFLSKEDKAKIMNAISKAENETSGEIRVHILKKNKIEDIFEEAIKWFSKLKMHLTKERNGILLVIAPNSRKFAIYGDEGINDKIDDSFWNKTRDNIQDSFKKEQYTQGIIKAVESTGKVLKIFFPIQPDDINELSNEITES